ncbi:MAG TPA: preprotein translocase subunit SecE [Planctomycetota bacterium]|nr:preprotein translocase subunit SecE [Planctomycetota bacterium]
MPAFEVYKPDQAVKSRWALGICTISLAAFGCYQLFYSLGEWAHGHIYSGFRPLGEEFPISWALVLSIVLFIAGAVGTWWAVNHARLVDFLTETELEMTKVSWSSKREVVGSSIVVVATVIILGVWIAAVDVTLSLPWGTWIGRLFR